MIFKYLNISAFIGLDFGRIIEIRERAERKMSVLTNLSPQPTV